MTITLKTLIKLIESVDQNKVIKVSLEKPHSFRGEPSHLALSMGSPKLVSDMLIEIKGIVGKTFDGYKDGKYKMTLDTQIHFAYYSSMDEYPENFINFVESLFN